MPFFAAARVCGKEDVNGFLLPRFFHRGNRATPLVVDVRHAGNGHRALRWYGKFRSDVRQAAGGANQHVAGRRCGSDVAPDALEVETDVHVVAVDDADPWNAPALGESLCEVSDGPKGVTDDDVRSPIAQLFFHPSCFSAYAGNRELWVWMVGQRKKPGNKGFGAVVQPPLRGLRYAHHGGATSLGVAGHARKWVHHFHVVSHGLQQVHVVFHEDPTRRVTRNGEEQRDDEDLDGQPSSVERLMNFGEVVNHAGSVVEQARANDTVCDAPVAQHGDVVGFHAAVNLDLYGASAGGNLRLNRF